MEHFDLIVIGAGPGGYEAAAEASGRYGMKTALIEARDLGGTCLNRGCIPTKTLLHTALLYQDLREHADAIGLTGTEAAGYDMKTLNSRKNDVVTELRTGIAQTMKKEKVRTFSGLGQILAPGTVRVKGESGDELLETDHILIATGSVPSRPPIPGSGLPGVVTSDELLDLDHAVSSITIIGGGVIGMEFASVFSALGAKVTVIEALDRIIANLDKEFSQSLKMSAKKSGIDIHTASSVTEIRQGDAGLITVFTEKEKSQEVPSDLVLLAVGRRANTEGLIPEDASPEIQGLVMDRGRILVDEKFRTNIPSIYAIGDVIPGIQLAHVATAEGRTAVAHMAGCDAGIDLKAVPSCIYTSPEIASVGLTLDEAKAAGIDCASQKYAMGANGKTLLEMQGRGFIKVVYEKGSGKILGAQMLAARATDMITQFSQAVVSGLTTCDMAKVMYPHPTFVEAIGETVRNAKL